jgi:hypothetical protein
LTGDRGTTNPVHRRDAEIAEKGRATEDLTTKATKDTKSTKENSGFRFWVSKNRDPFATFVVNRIVADELRRYGNILWIRSLSPTAFLRGFASFA